MNDKYLQYQLEDFLTDDQFLKWAEAKDKDVLWNQWLSDNPEALKAVKTGLKQAGAGKLKSMGSFAKYAKGVSG